MIMMNKIITDRYSLFNGDCIEVMRSLKDNSIDIVITDIPYGIDYSDWDVLHSNTNSALGKKTSHQEKDTSFKRRGKPINGWSKADKNIPYEYQEWCNKWAKELFRITKEASPILIFSSRRFQHRVSCALEDNGFMIRDVIIWEKDRCNPKAQRISKVLEKRGIIDERFKDYRIGNLAPYYEPIIFAMKPYRGTLTDRVIRDSIGGFNCISGKIPPNILHCDINKKNKYHEAEKPINLIEHLIDIFSIKDDVILDFTQGSGTTGVASIRKGKRYVGIEIDEKYFEIAKNRIENEL